MYDTLPDLLPLHPKVRQLLQACAGAGGRAVLVGGCVRDALLGLPGADLDVEVHGLAPDVLREVAAGLGRVDEVGRAFGVFKLRLGGQQLDLSVPRRDSKVGSGHRGIRADADPHLGLVEAARRRDLTVNAIAWDPLNGELIDPFGGRADILARRLAAVDARSFDEDPLRALRVAQFVARFGFTPVPELLEQCRSMEVSGLPAERVRGEVEKLLLRGKQPSAGWNFAHTTGLWARLVPEWDQPSPLALDRLAAAPIEHAPRRLALLLACTAPPDPLSRVLDQLKVHRWHGYHVADQARALSAAASRGHDPRPAPTRARWLAERLEVGLFAELVDDRPLLEAAIALGVEQAPLMPLLGGHDILALGVRPGALMGGILGKLRTAQLDGHVSSPEEALAWARRQLR